MLTKRIYFASAWSMDNVDAGRRLRADWKAFGLDIYSGWLDQSEHEMSATAEQFAYHWLRDAADIRDCDALILYLPKMSDNPRGALVEVGMALILNKPVLPVGVDHTALSTWQHYPLVLPRVRTLEEAYNYLRFLTL